MLRTINLPCAGAGAGACLPFASAGEGRTEGRIVDDWSIVAGNANGVPGLEGPPLGQTVREIWRALDAVGRRDSALSHIRRALLGDPRYQELKSRLLSGSNP